MRMGRRSWSKGELRRGGGGGVMMLMTVVVTVKERGVRIGCSRVGREGGRRGRGYDVIS